MTRPTPTTPREARLLLNTLEAWYRKNEHRYRPTRRVHLRGLFEVAHLPEHAMALAEVLRDWAKEPP
jgi:hypothetical protein